MKSASSANVGSGNARHDRNITLPKKPEIFLTGSRNIWLPSFFILTFFFSLIFLLLYMQIPKTKESDKQTKYRNFRSPGIASLRGPETCPVLLTDSPLCAAGKFPLIAYRNPAIRLFSVPFLFRFLLRFRFCPLCLHRFLRFVMRSGHCWLFRLCRSLRRLRFLRLCRSLR